MKFNLLSPAAVPRVQKLLAEKRFDSLNAVAWQYALCSLFDEAKNMNMLGELPRINFRDHFELRMDRDSSLEFVIMEWLDKNLPVYVRPKFCAAATTLVDRAYQQDQRADTEAKDLLRRLLRLSCQHDYFVGSGVSLTVALDPTVEPETRKWGALNLMNRDFSDRVPPSAWEDIEREMPNCWPLAYAVADQAAKKSPKRMLKVLDTIGDNLDAAGGVEGTMLHHTVMWSLGEVRSINADQRKEFGAAFACLKPKMRTFVRETLAEKSPLRTLLPE